jgi:hypothetical protein
MGETTLLYSVREQKARRRPQLSKSSTGVRVGLVVNREGTGTVIFQVPSLPPSHPRPQPNTRCIPSFLSVQLDFLFAALGSWAE